MQSDSHPHNDLAHDDFQDATHFTLKTYITGFVLAALLTAVPFWLVINRTIANVAVAAAVIVAFAVAQILVHTFAFLHVNARAQGGWTLVAYVFTAVLIVITIGGSLWIMNHLNLNMMPGMIGGPADRGM
jgi:cytochrome o ubiquinol oxidase operon protein cyoD